MKIKSIYNSKDDIPAGYEELYSERDGKWLLTGVEGIRTDADVARVQTALTQEKAKTKELKAKLDLFGDLDPEEVHTQLEEIDELRVKATANGGKVDDAQIQALVDAKVKKETATLTRENTKLKTTVDELTTSNTELSSTIKKSKIETAVRQAAEKGGVVATAIDDIVMYGERVLEVTEDGSVITKDGVGVTPGLTVDVLLSDMKEKRPHWWPASVGGGAGGGKNNGGMSDNPWSAANWNLTAQGAYVKQHGMAKAEQMAKLAGTSIGGDKPAEKK